MIRKSGSAHWSGTLREGAGTLSVESGVVDGAAYSFAKRFGDEKGTNPEELIGASHAACFAMALSANLTEADLKAEAIDARSTVSLEMPGGVPTVMKIHLEVTANIPGIAVDRFAELAQKTKETCPISRLLAAAEITMDARLA